MEQHKMSSSWRDEYKQALQERDVREKVSYQRIDDNLIAAFTDLLIRTTHLEAQAAALSAPLTPSTSQSTLPLPSTPSKRGNPLLPPPSSLPSTDPSVTQLRVDLASALRSVATLQTRIKVAETELSSLRTKTGKDGKMIEELTKERNYLNRKLRDRDEELRGKAGLLDNVQNEVISLNIELNMSEKNVEALKKENKELITRWMESKGREAEEMNRAFQQDQA